MDQIFVKNKLEEIISNLKLIRDYFSSYSFKENKENKENKEIKEILFNAEWPEAFKSDLICTSLADKKERGSAIIEFFIDQQMTSDQKFLDYGCGEGYSVVAAPTCLGCGLAVGYDIIKYNWPIGLNFFFSSSYEEVISTGPYDIILIFDVLDHIKKESRVEMLKKAANLLAPTGKIYIRVHPWLSRHGTHLYNKLNKAFIHLVLSEDELKRFVEEYDNYEEMIIDPLAAYDQYFKEASLKKERQQEWKEKIEDFFYTPFIAKRIEEKTRRNINDLPLDLTFIDYVLSKDL